MAALTFVRFSAPDLGTDQLAVVGYLPAVDLALFSCRIRTGPNPVPRAVAGTCAGRGLGTERARSPGPS